MSGESTKTSAPHWPRLHVGELLLDNQDFDNEEE